MTRGEDETVAVDPAGTLRVVRQRVSVKDGADFSRSKRKAEVARRAGVDRVDREPACLIGSFRKEWSLKRHG